jgi:hypothetical protein
MKYSISSLIFLTGGIILVSCGSNTLSSLTILVADTSSMHFKQYCGYGSLFCANTPNITSLSFSLSLMQLKADINNAIVNSPMIVDFIINANIYNQLSWF